MHTGIHKLYIRGKGTKKMQSKIVTTILEKEMDRKEFLQHVGMAFLALTGVSGLMRTFGQQQLPQTKIQNGYGAMPYGGAKN